MAISCFFIGASGGYLWILVHNILVAINGYFISGY
jgi:hypothetical protein